MECNISPFLTVANKNYCNKTFKFLHDKEEKIFIKRQKRLKTHKEGLYLKKHLEYNVNKFGYRCDHVIPPATDYMLVMGCSHTYGHSLHKEHRYSDLLEEYYNIPVLNVGKWGGSPNLIKDNIIQLLSSGHRLPKLILIQWPSSSRIYFGHFSSVFNSFAKVSNYFDSIELYSKTAQQQTHWLLSNFNIPFIEFKIYDRTGVYPNFVIDYARDYEHPGIDSNKKIFEYLRKKIDGI